MVDFELASLRWALGTQTAADLVDLATDALGQGLDGPNVRKLAGLPPDDFWAIKEAFEGVLSDLGIELREEQDALWHLARWIAAQMVLGEINPIDGSVMIWAEVWDRIDLEGDFRTFIGIASQYEDHPEDAQNLESLAVEAATELLQRERPRRWIRLQARRSMPPLAEPRSGRPISLAELPISAPLRSTLAEWAGDYDLAFDDPGRHRDTFESEDDAERFVQRGEDLAVQLQKELGHELQVEYTPEPTRPPGLRFLR